jgi:two-component system, response regulator YesN
MATLLLVDDEPTTLRGLTATIPWQTIGVSDVLTASDGNEALQTLRTAPVDIVVTDVRMPRVDGLVLIDEIAAHFSHVRVVILSGYENFVWAKHAIKRDVADYLLKPVDVAELMTVVGRLVSDIHGDKDGMSQDHGIGNRRSIRRAVRYLRENHHHPISLAEVAAEIGLSPNYFSSLFKQTTGESFSTTLNRIRISRAGDLLRSTDLTMADIADRVGYSDHKYFGRKFKEVMGVSPNEYRNREGE